MLSDSAAADADIWEKCSEQISPSQLKGRVFRIVESQEKVATNELVDTLEEQALLEEMLNATKPAIPEAAQDLSYLLFTPFRYPPLHYGSRFGRRFEPSLFYGSRSLETALAETAYYRLHFWFDMAQPPPIGKIKTQHTAFSAEIKTDNGLKLQDAPFAKYAAQLTSKSSYHATQPLGSMMREHNIEAFEYISARDKDEGLNVGIFSPGAFKSKKATSTMNIFCSTQAEGVEYLDDDGHVYLYRYEAFLERGEFPKLSA